MEQETQAATKEIVHFFSQPNALRSIVVLVIALTVAYVLSKVVALAIIKIAQIVAVRSDQTSDAERKVRLRRVETYLSVIIAAVRAIIVGVVAFYLWKALSPVATSGAAAIGASAFFIVLAGGTVGMLLRDITAGSAMIIEGWFNVGDHIKVEPFWDVSGVVERMTLRSTKIRALNGEVIWMHNQHITGVHVTPGGVRTLAVDTFVNNQKVGKNLVEKAIATMPVGTLKVVNKPTINLIEQWGEKLYLITTIAEVPPGREWLMEDFFIQSLAELDARRKGPKTLVRPPIVRFADAAAERSFRRAVKMGQQDNK